MTADRTGIPEEPEAQREPTRPADRRKAMGKRKGVSRSMLGMVLAVSLVAAACGSEAASPTEQPDPEAADGEWSSQELAAEPGGDRPIVFAADGDQVVAVVVSEDDLVTGFATDDDGTFAAGEPSQAGADFLILGGVAPLGDRWVAVRNGVRSMATNSSPSRCGPSRRRTD